MEISKNSTHFHERTRSFSLVPLSFRASTMFGLSESIISHSKYMIDSNASIKSDAISFKLIIVWSSLQILPHRCKSIYRSMCICILEEMHIINVIAFHGKEKIKTECQTEAASHSIRPHKMLN